MASNTEAGHNKNVTNFETLIIACTGLEHLIIRQIQTSLFQF